MTHNNGVFIVFVEDDQDEDLEFPDREFFVSLNQSLLTYMEEQ